MMTYQAYDASSAQKRLYLVDRLQGDNTLYNIPFSWRIEGDLDPLRLETALKKLIRHHETLRTCFTLKNGEVYQKVYDHLEFQLEYREVGKNFLIDPETVFNDFVQPFDLDSVPLWRLQLLQMGSHKQLLRFDIHHIICDGTSVAVLINDLLTLYNRKELPELEYQYVDFTHWQNEQWKTDRLKRQEQYWLNLLAEELPVLNLPTDYPRSTETNIVGAAIEFEIGDDLTARMNRLAARNKTTLYVVLLAVYNVLLSKYSNQEDIMVGTAVSGRSHREFEPIIGMFVNTLVLRNNPSAGKTFDEFLREVSQNTFSAFENQDYPFELLVEKRVPQRHLNRNPIFDTMLVLQNYSREIHLLDHGNEELVLIPYHFKTRQSKFDLTLEIFEVDRHLHINLEYHQFLFRQDAIRRFTEHFINIVRQVVSGIPLTLSGIRILSEAEQEHLLYILNDTAAPYPLNKTIQECFEEQVERTPDLIALLGQIPGGVGQGHLSYRALNEKANQWAHLLRQKGLRPDRAAALMVGRSTEMVTGILGIIKAGGAYLPIDTDYPEKRILSILEESGARILLTAETILQGKAISFNDLQNLKASRIKPVITPAREPVEDFDLLPVPDRTLVDYEKYHRDIGIAMARHTVSLQATRGCPYNCAYCHKIWPKKHVVRSAEKIFAEIQQLRDAGVKRFVFIDDIFNLHIKNSSRLLETIIKKCPGIQLFFPNGLRGDILGKEFIDLMVKAGTVNIALALESASPRIQEMIGKNLNLEKFSDSVSYITQKYPQVLLEMELMVGFPTETEEEALMSLDYLERLHWVHFPNLHILKIYPNTDMCRLALENGISMAAIEASAHLAYHELPGTLPFPGSFVRLLQTRFMNQYMLSKERLNHLLPYQVKTLSQEELTRKYDSYFPQKITSFSDILQLGGISAEEFGAVRFLGDKKMAAPGFLQDIKQAFAARSRQEQQKNRETLRLLLLDLSQFFSRDRANMLYDMVEEPLGLMYLLTYLNREFGNRLQGKIAKSRMDFDSFAELTKLIEDFQPDLIGIRTLSYYKEFFHKTVAVIREGGATVPIIAGGPYATSDYPQMLQDHNVNLAVLGEGELTLTHLIKKIMAHHNRLPPEPELLEIPGIALIKETDKKILKARKREILLTDRCSQALTGQPRGNPGKINHSNHLLYLISTSGSTGKPKSVALEHRNLVNLLNFEFNRTGVPFNRVLQFASIGFDISFQETFSTLLSGGVLYLIDKEIKLDIPALFQVIRDNLIEVLFLPPAFLKFVFEEEDYAGLFPKTVRHIIAAGEQLIVPERFSRYLSENGVYLHNHYGPAETHVVTTLTLPPTAVKPRRPSIGNPIANTRILIMDDYFMLKPRGVVGEIYIAGANVGRGYLNNPELTHERFVSGFNRYSRSHKSYRSYIFYKTGDLGRWLADGGIEFLGRIDHQVKIRGFRIETGEIENRVREYKGIKEAVVTIRTEEGNDPYLCAYIVPPGKETGKIELADLALFLSAHLPGYMIPTALVTLARLPLTPSGKVDRKSLPKPRQAEDPDYVPPCNPIQKTLVRIWAETLGLEKNHIGIAANFFHLGGHSLKATILLTRIHKELDVQVPLSEIFTSQTIRQLSHYIEAAVKNKFSTIQPVEKKEYYPLSSAQKRLYFLQQMDTASTAYNLPLVLPLAEDLPLRRLEAVLKKMAARHESLRTSFVMVAEEPVQRVHPFNELEFASEYYDFATDDLEGKNYKLQMTNDKETGDHHSSFIKTPNHSFIRPFDLSCAPLIRSAVVKPPGANRLWMVDFHHIVSDGTSQTVLAREFLALYRGDRLEPLRLHYKDFSQWQNRLFASGAVKSQEEYWLNLYSGSGSGEIPRLNLVGDWQRPEVFTFSGDHYDFLLERDTALKLKALSTRQEGTLFMNLLAILDTLFHKYTGQTDIIIGSGIAARPHADLRHIIGMFVNMLALRNYPEGEKTYEYFFTEVMANSLNAFANQDIPFETLIDKLDLERDLSRNPLFDISLVVQNLERVETKTSLLPGQTREILPPLEVGHKTSKFDLTFLIAEDEENLRVTIEYYTGVFKRETVQRLALHFKNLVKTIIANPSVKLKDIDILSPEEKHRLLHDFNDTTRDYPQDKTIQRLFAEQVQRTPDQVALEGLKLQTNSKSQITNYKKISITYRELNREAGGLANTLRAKGVQADCIVGIMAERSVKMIVGILAILKANGAYMPIDPDYPPERSDYMMKDSNAKILLKKHDLSSWLASAPQALLNRSAGHPLNFPSSYLPNSLTSPPSSLAYIIYTSGTTGRPKGTPVRHRSLNNLCHWHIRRFAITSDDRSANYANFGFDASVWEIFPYLIAGAPLHIINEEIRSDLHRLNDYFEKNQITIAFLPTPIYEEFMNLRNRSLRVLLTGGDKLRRYIKRDYRLVNNYGPTENTVVSSSFIVDEHYLNIPIGKPTDNTQLYILDKNLQLLPLGAAGELCISGAGLSSGYLNSPELTAEKFVTSFNRSYRSYRSYKSYIIYKTGDLARLLRDGNIEFLGRLDQQVKIRGFRIQLEEIESQLLKREEIKKAAVLDLEAEKGDGDKFLCAYLIFHQPGLLDKNPAFPDQLKEYLSHSLPDYMIPAYFMELKEIPLTPNGKIHRKALPAPEVKTGENYAPPRDDLEKRLVELWSTVLGLAREKIGIDSNFFKLGGHSLKAAILVSKIHKKLNVKITLAEIFKNPTIRGLSQHIKGLAAEKYTAIEPLEKKEYYPLSSAQKRLYILQQMEFSGTAYNMLQIIPLADEFAEGKLVDAFITLIQRHESLRTSFPMVNGAPVQKIADQVEFKIRRVETAANKGNHWAHTRNDTIHRFLRPFDLAHAPLLRVGLVYPPRTPAAAPSPYQEEANRCILLVDMHHIITDGTSQILLEKEFSALYSNPGEKLTPLRLHYKDFSGWRHKEARQAEMEQQQAFWLEHFQGEIPVLNLPNDYARPATQSFAGSTREFTIDNEETGRLKRLAAASGSTLYIVLLAAFYVVMAKVSGQEDIVIGTGTAGRRHSDLHPIIGLFVNTLALRNHPRPGISFADFLAEVKKRTLDAFENQDYPFENLVENLELKRDTGRNPLFDVMLMLQNFEFPNTGNTPPAPSPALPPGPAPGPAAAAPLNTDMYTYRQRISKFDLTLFGNEENGALHFSFEYGTTLFKPETIDLFITYFKEITSAAAANPEKKLVEIEKILVQRKQELLRQWNLQLKQEVETLARTCHPPTLQQKLSDSFNKFPQGPATAIEYHNEIITYHQLDRRSNTIANWLLNKKSLEQETFIGILLEDRVAVITALLGILKARCVFVPLEPAYPPSRLAAMIAAAGIRFIITDSVNLDRWPYPRSGTGTGPRQPTEFILWDQLVSSQSQHPETEQAPGLPYSPADNIYIYFTSGTTGTPRAIAGKNSSLLHFIDWEIETFGVNPTFRFSQLTTPVFDAFLRDVFVPLCSGAVICLPGGRDTIQDSQRLINWVNDSGITLIHCVPSLFRLLDTARLTPDHFKGLKFILMSGERVEPPDLANWYHLFNERVQLVNLWGTSETTLAKTCYFIQPTDAHRDRIPVGRPLKGARVVVLDKQSEICDQLVTGELYIKTPFRTGGYYDEPELNNQRFIQDPFSRDKNERLHKTGDLGCILPDGNIDLAGRKDRQVKIRGIRIELEEIESLLIRHPRVMEAAVVKKEISGTNELLYGYVTVSPLKPEKTKNPRETTAELLISTLKAYLSEKLPGYMIPGKLIPVERIPRKPNGKIDYNALPDPLAEKGNRFQPPRDRVEEKIHRLWIDILGIENPGVTSSFFELGGNSLNTMTLISRLHREFDTRIPLADIFNNATIAKQAAIIKKARRDRYRSIEPLETKEYYALSSAQKRLYILQRMEETGTGYNMPQAIILEGKLKKNKIAKIFKTLIQRHDSLRTSFLTVNEEPVQRVHDQVEFDIQYDELASSFLRPFDLSRAPLLRVGLIEIEKQKHLFLIDMHHIITDGTSQVLLVNEFMTLYALPGAGQGNPLTPLKLRYTDYALWQISQGEKKRVMKQEAYWLKEFENEIPVLNIITDYPRPAIKRFEGSTLDFAIDKKEIAGLKKRAADNGATLYMILLAIFNVVLAKLGGQEDLVLGSPSAGRRHADLEPIMGMFVNTLALRNFPCGEKIFSRFLQEVKERTLAAFENQDYQFEDLVDRVAARRDTSRNPLFDVMLVLQNMENQAVNQPGLKFTPSKTKKNIAKFDLALMAIEAEHQLLFTLEYSTSLFKKETIQRIAAYFKKAVSVIKENPGIRLKEIELISAEEKNQLVVEFNRTAAPYPQDKPLQQLFEKQAQLDPDKTALLGHMAARPQGQGHLTYRALAEVSTAWAILLKKKGLQGETVVGLMGERVIETIVAILAILKAGGAYLPIDPEYPQERIRYMLKDSNAKFLLKDNDSSSWLASAPQALIDLSAGHQINFPSSRPTSLAYLLYTSGSTGKPKGTAVQHQNVARLVMNANFIDVTPADRLLLTGAFVFDITTFETWWPLLNGLTLFLANQRVILDAEKLENFIVKNKISILHLIPQLFNQLADQRIGIFNGLRYFLVGGDRVRPKHVNRLRKARPGVKILHMYGPTENTTFSTFHPVDRDHDITIPIGKPLGNSSAYIVDRYDRLVPIGVAGELIVGGDGVARGYLNNPELTHEKFCLRRPGGALFEKTAPPGPPSKNFLLVQSPIYKTGDLACWQADGNIRFLGRIDRQVKIRGMRIELGEIENQLSNHKNIKEAVVIASETNEYLCAYLVAANPAEKTAFPGLKEHLAMRLPAYMIPSDFIFLETVPLTPSGKVDRKALPAPGPKPGNEYTAPRNSIEKKLVALWREILDNRVHAAIGLDDNFFELGGHSLKATTLAAKIHKELDVKVPLVAIFKNNTIRAQARIITGLAQDRYASITPVEKKEYHELSPAQKRLYFLQQLGKNNTGYNIPLVISLGKETLSHHPELLLKKLIARHESLRTSFIMVREKPVQRVHAPGEVEFEIESYDPVQAGEAVPGIINGFVRPFDLTRAPLIRSGIVKLPDGSCTWMVDIHHIVSDGTSHAVLAKDFLSLDRGKELNPLRIQYKDFSYWQNRLLTGNIIKLQEDYWLKLYPDRNEIPRLELGLDHKRPDVFTFAGDSYHFALEAEETLKFKALNLQSGGTLFMSILTTLDTLFYKYTGQSDIIIGTVIAGRRHADLQEIIGMFVNTLVMRGHPHGDKPYSSLLKEVIASSIQAFENQDLQFEALVEKLDLERDLSRNPLFDITMVIQNLNPAAEELNKTGENPTSPGSLDTPKTSKFDMTFIISEADDRIQITIEYYTGIFTQQRIRRLAGHFREIIRAVIIEPSIKLKDIDILTTEEKRQLLKTLNHNTGSYPSDKTIHQRFAEQVQQIPDRVALVGRSDLSDPSDLSDLSITYRELHEQSDHLANRLQEKGVKPDTIVGIMMERSIEIIIGILGILKAGGAYMPIDPDYPQERSNYMLIDSGAKILLKSHDLSASPPFNFPASDLPNFLTSPPSSLAYVIYTSGTTGNPKGSLIQHRNVVSLMFHDGHLFDFSDKDIWTLFHSYCFDFSVWEMYGALLYGGKLVIIPKMTARDPQKYLEILKSENVTILNQTPVVFYQLAQRELESPGKKLRLRYVIFGGEALTPAKLKPWQKKYPGTKLINMYGITETTVHVTYKEIQDSDIHLDISNIGTPLPTLNTVVLDRHQKLLPIGIPGELCVSGAGVCRGYLNRPELTHEKFGHDLKDFWDYHDENNKGFCGGSRGAVFSKSAPLAARGKSYRSGDLGKLNARGELEYLGRIDHQVKIRGYRVELGEIETQLLKHEKIKETVVIAAGNNEYLCAYLVAVNPAEKIAGPELKEFLSIHLPAYMIPAYFIPLEKIPVTPSGKLDRKALPEPGSQPGKQYAAPRNKREEQLVALWRETLDNRGHTPIGIDDNFFDLGGHSLNAAVMAAKIHKELNVKVPLQEIFRNQTIRLLSKQIADLAEDKYTAIEPVEKREYYTLSSAQKRLFFLQQVDLNSTGYNMPLFLSLEKEIRIDHLQSLLKKLVARHESLRTSFVLVAEEPVQRVHPFNEVEFASEYYDLTTDDLEGKNYKLQMTNDKETGDHHSSFITHHSFIRPFDLSRPPLIRSGVLRHPGGNWTWMVDLHHIVSDGTSHSVLTKDFLSLYQGEELPPLRLQYKDYSQWQVHLMETGATKAQEDYWLGLYSDTGAKQPPRLNLAADYKRPELFTFAGDHYNCRVEGEAAVKFKTLGHRQGATLYMNSLAALNTLFHKYTGQTDIIIGSMIAGRPHADLQHIIGMFVNTLALRNTPTGEKTYHSFLKEVMTNSINAFANQDVQFEQLVDHLDLARDFSRNPLFDIAMMVHNPGEVEKSPELLLEQKEENPLPAFDYKISKFDMTFLIAEHGEDIHITIEYYTGIFKAETIQRLASHFINVIRSISRDPLSRLKDIELMSAEEKSQILYDFNDTARDYPKDKTLHRLLAEQVEQTPHRIALVGQSNLSDPSGMSGLSITYRELLEQSDRLALILKEKGVKPGTLVGLMTERSIQMIAGLVGILKAGAAYLPIDPAYPQERIRRMLKDSGITILLTGHDLSSQLSSAPRALLNRSAGHPFNFPSSYLPHFLTSPPSSLAYIIYTSGSTGRPKGVMVAHRNVVRLVKNSDFIDLSPDDRLLLTGTMAFDITTFEIWWPLLHGLTLVLVDQNSILEAEKLGNCLARQRISLLHLIPQLFNQLASQSIEIFRGLRVLLVGGDLVRPQYVNVLRNTYEDIKILHMYGPSENTTFSTYFPVKQNYDTVIPIGKPIGNSSVYIVDRYDKWVPIGVPGELLVGGDGIARGYLNNPELTAEKFCLRRPGALFKKTAPGPRKNSLLKEMNKGIDHSEQIIFAEGVSSPEGHLHLRAKSQEPRAILYKTGDLARWLPEGNCEFLGRIDHQVKIRGIRIELAEIESQLLKYHKIAEAVVTTEEYLDESKTEEKYLCAYLELKNKETIEISEVKDFLSARLPGYMIPTVIMPLEKIPLTPSGKIDRKKLPQPRIHRTEGYAAPGNETEKMLVKIWGNVLNLASPGAIGIDDNFFDLGGHSLKAAALTARVYSVMKVKIPLGEIFKIPTIRGQAHYLAGAKQGPDILIEPAEQRTHWPLSALQKGLYILEQVKKAGTAYNLPMVMTVEGRLKKSHLEKTFQRLLQHHESLRTSFARGTTDVVQRVHREIPFAIEFFDLKTNRADEAIGQQQQQQQQQKQRLEKLIRDFIRPFDLGQAPLIRAGLIELAPAKHLLLFDIHHIISDGTSLGILIRDVVALYENKKLPPPRLQYNDFALWQNSSPGQTLIKQQETYWLNRFKGEIPVLSLYTDYPRPALQRFEGNTLTFTLEAGTKEQIRQLNRETGTTLYMLLLAVYNVLLAKYSGQEDIVVGSPIAGREHTDFDPIIGLFINPLPMRNFPGATKHFLQFLNEVKENTLRDFRNQQYPFGHLVEKLGLTREMSRNPLFDVELALQNMETAELRIEGLRFTPYQSPVSQRSQVDVTFNVIESKDAIHINVLYCTALFKEETLRGFIASFQKILTAVLENREIRLKDIRLVQDFNRVKSNAYNDKSTEFDL